MQRFTFTIPKNAVTGLSRFSMYAVDSIMWMDNDGGKKSHIHRTKGVIIFFDSLDKAGATNLCEVERGRGPRPSNLGNADRPIMGTHRLRMCIGLYYV